MPKIENWTRDRAEEDYFSWEHDFYNRTVEVAKTRYDYPGSDWTVTVPLEVSSSSDVHRPTFSERFDNKSDAMEFARYFMKNHTYSLPDHELNQLGEQYA